jgi:ParB family chromosome partitioning protein
MPSSTKRRPRSLADQLLEEAGEGEITAEEQAAAAESSFRPVPRALLVPIERIVPSRDNPRKSFAHLDELAESIAERGVLQPLLVRRDTERPGYYITVAGARRLLAARIVQGSDDAAVRQRVAALPTVVMDETERDAFADALAENLSRDDLSRAEVMDALLRLQREYGWSARYIARRTGRSVGDVAELLGVAKDDEVGVLVRDEIISATVGGQIRRLRKDLQAEVIVGVRAGRVKTVADVQRLRRQESSPAMPNAMRADKRPISDTGPSTEAGVRQSSMEIPAREQLQEVGEVSDIGHLDRDAGAPTGDQGDPESSTARPDVEISGAVDAVVRAVGALLRLPVSVDVASLAILRQARDDLSRYIERQEQVGRM